MRVLADVHHGLDSPSCVTGTLSYSQVVGNRSIVDDSPVSLNTSVPLLAQSSVAPLPADFMIRLTNCLADLFSLSLHQESLSKSRSLITAAVHKHFSDVLTVSNLSASKSTNVFASTDHTCVSLDHPVATSADRAVVAPADCAVVAPTDCPVVASADHDGVASGMSSPTLDEVCSIGDEFGSGLGVENFKLVSDSDMSGEDISSGKEWVSVAPRRRDGQNGVNHLSASSTKPSPVLGTGRRDPNGNGKLPLSAGTSTRRAGRSKSRNSRKK
jgi:hypothetical protein